MNDIEKRISKKIGKTIFEYKMIEDNDRIAVAVSGGKDSLTLLYDLKKRQKSFPVKYDFEVVHIVTDFSTHNIERVVNIFEEFDVKYHILHIPVLQRVKANKKMNCYWCSTQRRLELIKFAEKYRFNKIALGHHLDDVVQTFLMNIFFKKEIATMLPKFTYKKFPITVIRPLARVKESEIAIFAKKMGFVGLSCNCGYEDNSKRLVVKEMINSMADKCHNLRENIFDSMKNINHEYLDV